MMPKRFYTALVVLLFLLFLVTYLPIHGEAEIYDTVVRLHVLANSDSEADQALKLKVRDGVLACTAPLLEGVSSRDEAVEIITRHMDDIYAAAEAVVAAETPDGGERQRVKIILGTEDYPTRSYETCAFPAGEYVSLRVCLGDAEGENWWCVLFPPMCLSAATAEDSAEDAFISVGLSKDSRCWRCGSRGERATAGNEMPNSKFPRTQVPPRRVWLVGEPPLAWRLRSP